MGSWYDRLRDVPGAPTLWAAIDTLRLLPRAFTRRTPLAGDPERLSCEPFFFVGSGRSGHTLLRAMLCARGDVGIPPESYVLGPLARDFAALGFLPWDALVRLVVGTFEGHDQFETWELDLADVRPTLSALEGADRCLARLVDEIYRAYLEAHFPEADRWGDKTPMNTMHLRWIEATFPSARYIHLLRDGRDVAASYVNAGIYPDLDEAAARWRTSVTRAKDLRRRVGEDRLLPVRYEDLVSDPESEARRVCRFLGLDFRERMLAFHEDADELGDTHLSHHARVHEPISTSSIGRWRDLDPDDRDRLESLLGETLEDAGYGADGESL